MIGISIFHSVSARRRLLGLAIGAFGLTAAVGCTGLEALDAEAAQAVVQNIDSLSGEVTVEFKDGTTTTFNLADVDIEALGQLIDGVALEAGDEVEVELDSSKRVRALTPHATNVLGVIRNVDTDANTLTIQAAYGAELVVTLTARTRFDLDDDSHGTVTGLAPGMAVTVKYDTGTNEALRIRHEHRNRDNDEDELKGVITALDPDAQSITVETQNGVSETYTVQSYTEIEIHDDAAFGDLEVGMLVKIEFDQDTLALYEVHVKVDDDDDDDHGRGHDEHDGDDHDRGGDDADGPVGELHGRILAVHPDANSITVEHENGIEETYTALTDTEIVIGEPATFGDLEAGQLVRIWFDRETLELILMHVRVEDDDDGRDHDDDDEHEVKGVITVLDPDASSITVDDGRGSTETYTVHSDTEIEIHGRASFGDLEVGMLVKVEFDPDTLALHKVQVKVDDDDDDDD